MATNTGMDFFTNLSLDEFVDIAKEVAENVKKNNLRTSTRDWW